MSAVPAPRTETVVIEWTAVEGPRRCLSCGHDHWAWKATKSSQPLWTSPHLAPQWGYCSTDCNCTGLRLAPVPRAGDER